ncbi:hypothetical protein DYI24_27510, partial [Rhodopseudomonas sp. BR0C11]|nr:hypothetical protein [Rhodopseudomonas sp. BR0C11]
VVRLVDVVGLVVIVDRERRVLGVAGAFLSVVVVVRVGLVVRRRGLRGFDRRGSFGNRRLLVRDGLGCSAHLGLGRSGCFGRRGFDVAVLVIVGGVRGVVLLGGLTLRQLMHQALALGVRLDLVRLVMVGSLVRLLGRNVGNGFDDLALHPLAVVASAMAAMSRPAAAGALLAFFFGFAVGAFVGFDQGLPVGDRDLIIVGMDFA